MEHHGPIVADRAALAAGPLLVAAAVLVLGTFRPGVVERPDFSSLLGSATSGAPATAEPPARGASEVGVGARVHDRALGTTLASEDDGALVAIGPDGDRMVLARPPEIAAAAWSPDAKRAAYLVPTDGFVRPATVCVVTAASGTPNCVEHAAEGLTWHPSGEVLLIRDGDDLRAVDVHPMGIRAPTAEELAAWER